MNYNLRRITESVKEHVENNFRPLPESGKVVLTNLTEEVVGAFGEAIALIDSNDIAAVTRLRAKCDNIKDEISDLTHQVYGQIQNGSAKNLTVTYVYLNLLQETQEMVSSLRKLLRASAKLNNGSIPVRGWRPETTTK